MPTILLSPTFVRCAATAPNLRKTDFFDTQCPGFLLEVRRSGGKTFYQRYRDCHGRERQFKIGSASILSVVQARKKAKSILAQALLGDDPQRERKALRQIGTLKQFVESNYLPFIRVNKRSWRTDETLLRLHILPDMGGYTLDGVTSAHAASLIERMREKGYSSGTTNRIIILLRFIFRLAQKWKVPGAGACPAAGLRTVPDNCCQRFLSREEVERLVAALDRDMNQTAARAIRLLLLTGARRNEITQARWEYVNWSNKTLLVPVAKSGRPRCIALNSVALELLESIIPVPGNPFVFPSKVTGRPSASLHFPWLRIRKTAGLLDVRLHDLRHSYASFLVNHGVSLYVVQHLLGHTQPRMTQRYAHLVQQTLSDAAGVVGDLVRQAEVVGQIPTFLVEGSKQLEEHSIESHHWDRSRTQCLRD